MLFLFPALYISIFLKLIFKTYSSCSATLVCHNDLKVALKIKGDIYLYFLHLDTQ